MTALGGTLSCKTSCHLRMLTLNVLFQVWSLVKSVAAYLACKRFQFVMNHAQMSCVTADRRESFFALSAVLSEFWHFVARWNLSDGDRPSFFVGCVFGGFSIRSSWRLTYFVAVGSETNDPMQMDMIAVLALAGARVRTRHRFAHDRSASVEKVQTWFK